MSRVIFPKKNHMNFWIKIVKRIGHREFVHRTQTTGVSWSKVTKHVIAIIKETDADYAEVSYDGTGESRKIDRLKEKS